jgi:hypothetical protein
MYVIFDRWQHIVCREFLVLLGWAGQALLCGMSQLSTTILPFMLCLISKEHCFWRSPNWFHSQGRNWSCRGWYSISRETVQVDSSSLTQALSSSNWLLFAFAIGNHIQTKRGYERGSLHEDAIILLCLNTEPRNSDPNWRYSSNIVYFRQIHCHIRPYPFENTWSRVPLVRQALPPFSDTESSSFGPNPSGDVSNPLTHVTRGWLRFNETCPEPIPRNFPNSAKLYGSMFGYIR